MLADQIINNEGLRRDHDHFKEMTVKISAATKFVLAPDFTQAADGLVDNFKELLRIAPFCRLPYPLTWFEFSQAHRPTFNTSEISEPGVQHRPNRIGFMNEALDNRMSKWRAHLFWSFKEDKLIANNCNASTIAVDYDTERPLSNLENLVNIVPAEFGLVSMALLLSITRDSTELKRLTEILRKDWAGEIRYLFAVLGLLNARNVIETEYVDKAEHNRKRAKHGGLPLFSHTILKVRAIHKPTLVVGCWHPGQCALAFRARPFQAKSHRHLLVVTFQAWQSAAWCS